ncbi:MAG: FAD-dependent oxidoreductase, partial [Sphingobium sp.]
MRGSGPLWRLLGEARRANLEDMGVPAPTRTPEGITRRRALAALAAASAVPLIGWPQPVRAREAMRVVVIGGGLAGLCALDKLVANGIDAKLYEARGRLGGRVFTANNAPEPGLDIEDGANLINTDHDDMLKLADRFGIALIDRKPMHAHSRYVVDGKMIDDAVLVRDLRAIAGQISKDAAALDGNYDVMAPVFDKLSVS